MDTVEFNDIKGFNNRVLLPRTSCELLFTIPGKIILLPKNGIIDKEIGGWSHDAYIGTVQ